MCRCLISVIDGNRSRFEDHMKNEHDVRYDLDSLLVLSVMTRGEKSLLIREFDTKLIERICGDKLRKPEKLGFENSNVVRIKEDQDDKLEISSLEDEETNEINSIDENQKLPTGVAVVAPIDRVVREGVLKCKLCPRYIKQSQMIKHKEESHKKVIKDNPENNEKLLTEENSQRKNVEVELDQNICSKKRTEDNSSLKIDKNPKKRREESRSGEEEDEDWTVRSKRRVRISCRYCSKKFGSKLSVTTHERKVHTERGC